MSTNTTPPVPQQPAPPRPVPQAGAIHLPPLHGPWAAQTGFGRRCPGPGRPASTATVIALPLAGLVGALSIPLDRAGVGWLITVIAGVAALVVARAIPQRTSATAPKPL